MTSLVKRAWQHLTASYLSFIYPSHCLHCDWPVVGDRVFCDSCVSILHLLDEQGRCPHCFMEVEAAERTVCRACRQRPPPWSRLAAAFEYAGPAAALVKRLKYGGQPYLALSAAAFLVAQMDRLQWPIPDVIVPVPMPILRRLYRGYNQSQLVSVELGRLLQRPVLSALGRRSGDFAQAGLSLAQRQRLSSTRFRLKKRAAVADSVVLLVDDVMTTGATLRCCADALVAGYPRDVWVMAVCRAAS